MNGKNGENNPRKKSNSDNLLSTLVNVLLEEPEAEPEGEPDASTGVHCDFHQLFVNA